MTPRDKIIAYLATHSLSQTHFAKTCGVAQSRLNDVVRNNKDVTLRLAVPMAGQLGMTLDDFMNDKIDWPSSSPPLPPCSLSPDEEYVLGLAKQLGVGNMDWAEVARRRLLGLSLVEGED